MPTIPASENTFRKKILKFYSSKFSCENKQINVVDV